MADRSLEKTEILANGDPRLQPRLGRYRLERRLGAGGMAEVFLARAEGAFGFEKQVVVKRIRRQLAQNKKFVEMFLREARVLARLDHPNIVRIIELDEDKGEYFLALEYLEGLSLREVAERHWAVGRPLPIETLMQIVADAAMGLDYAHKQKDQQGNALHLVHRDVSPDNLFVTTTGTVKVIDFGIAKLEGTDQLTQAGELKGKIPFMSPEQLQGVSLDARTDLFALGITFYWLLAGRRPFDGASDVHTMKAILEDPPPALRSYNAKVPALLEDVVHTLLEKDRQKRLASAGALHDTLGTLLLALPRAAPPASLLVDAAQTLPDVDHEVVPASLAAVPVLPWPDRDVRPPDDLASAETRQQRVAAVPLQPPKAVESTQRIPVYAPVVGTQVVQKDDLFTTAEQDFKVPSDPVIDVERVPAAVDATLAVEPVQILPSSADGDVVTLVNQPAVVAQAEGPRDVEAELVVHEPPSRAVPIAAGVVSALVLVGGGLWFSGVVESLQKLSGAVEDAVVDAGFVASVLTEPEVHDAGIEAAVVFDAGEVVVADAGEEEMPEGEGEVDAGVAFEEDAGEEEEGRDGPRERRRAVSVLAPSSVQWQGASGEVYGAGRGTLRLPDSVKLVYAVDLRRGSKTRVVLDKGTRVVDWNKLPRQKLNIRVRPYADVFLGKEAFGTTPIAPITTVVGTYEVRLVYKGIEKKVNVEVKAKGPATLNVVMK